MKVSILIITSLFLSTILIAQGQPGLHVAENHSVLFGQDTISVGMKTMWLPSKGAFRSGNMTSSWNYSSLGNLSAAFGSDTYAFGNYSFATGLGTNANSFAEFSIGQYSLTGGGANAWVVGVDPVFEIGNGTGPNVNSRSNMLTVQKNGNVKIGDMKDASEIISEKLVVDGAIVLADTQNQNPQEGTIKYDANSSSFQGYNGNQWSNFATEGSHGIPLTCTINNVNNFDIRYLDCVIDGGIDPTQSFQSIPAGKRFNVTHIAVYPTIVFDSSVAGVGWAIRLSRDPVSGGNNIMYELHGINVESKHVTFNHPIMVLNPADRIIAQNLTSNDFTNRCRVYLSGVLVDIN